MKLQGEKYFCFMWRVREAGGHTHGSWIFLHICPKTWFVFSQSSWEVFTSSGVEGHKHSWGKPDLCPGPVRIYTEGKEMLQHLSSYLEVGRWVPECLAVQYQGGLRALRKLKQLPGETFPWVWRLIPLEQLLGCNLGWKIKFSSGIVHGTT